MNENAKTLTFIAVAAAVAALAIIVSRQSLPGSGQENVNNQPLYPKFDDPLKVASLEIVEYDDQRSEVHPFHVAQADVKGKTRWSIPSREDYPADAKDQVASAAAGLMGLKIVEMQSDDQGDQRMYGVIDPMTAKPGETGVGARVVMKDKDGKQLLALVIGNEVPRRPGLRYVRKVGETPIYVVEAKTDKLSTKFEDWIERNLLGISSFDIKDLRIDDYSIRLTSEGAGIEQRGKMRIEYNDAGEPKWKVADDQKFIVDDKAPEGWRWAPRKMANNEELNAAKLDELKTSLDDLKIIDVSRKPRGLSADLKVAADFPTAGAAAASLQEKGFFPVRLEKEVGLFSNEGEIRVDMKDGVEYVLRFGGIAGAGPSKKYNKHKGKEKDEEKKGGGLNRYLFVMAQFNPDMIAKPKLEPLPEIKKEAEKKDAEKKSADKKAATGGRASAKPQAANVEAERQRIEKDNKRKQEEYEQKVADGKKHVADLNARFADWYYVISDEVYRKIHLGHDDIFKKKEAKKDAAKAPATPADALESLKSVGPEGE